MSREEAIKTRVKTLDPNKDARLKAVLELADISKDIEKLNQRVLGVMQKLLDDIRRKP